MNGGQSASRDDSGPRLRIKMTEHARQLESIFEAAGDGMAIYDTHGKLLQWNAALEALFELAQLPGYTALPVETRPAALQVRDERDQPMPPDHLPFMRAAHGETLTGAHTVDLKITTPSGTVKFVNASAAPLRDDNGEVSGAVTIYRDVTERRTLEQTARESAERLRLALDASSSGSFVWYVEDDRGEPDMQMLRLFGLPPDGTLNLAVALATLIHPDDRAGYAAAIAQASDPHGSGELREEIRVRQPDGTYKWLAITAQVYFEGEPRHATRMAGTATDITERKRLEQRTLESLDALLAMAGALVTAPEDAASDAAAAMRAVVRQVVALTQRVLGGAYTSVVLEDPETRQIEPLAVVGLAPAQETAWWQEVKGARLEAFMSAEDAARLRAGQEVIITEEGAAPSADDDPHAAPIRPTLKTPVQLDRQLLTLTVELHDRPAFTAQERELARAAARLAGLAIERERLLRLRAEADARMLAEQAAIAQMQTFVGIAGHELRTPVTSLRANVQLAERALRASLSASPDAELPTAVEAKLSRAQILLESADRQTLRLNRLIEDLLDMTRIASGKLELRLATDDLDDVVRAAVEALRLAWPRRDIALTITAAPLTLLLDADRIGQVVTNYLTNALKYSADDRSVTVSVGAEGKTARVAVRDHGPGLSPAAQARLWEPFHQVAGVQQQSGFSSGLGLGLHICKTIVERHGGAVGVESTPGDGSVFWFTLPLREDA